MNMFRKPAPVRLQTIRPGRFERGKRARTANTPTRMTKYWEGIQLNQSRCEPQFQCQFKTRWLQCFERESVEESCIQRMDCDDGSLESVDDEGWS